MARVLVCEPVKETRYLIERVVARMGHEIVRDYTPDVDVVFYDPASAIGMAQARSARRLWPDVLLVACCAAPPRATITGPRPVAFLMQPFAPADVRRALETALQDPIASAPSSSSSR